MKSGWQVFPITALGIVGFLTVVDFFGVQAAMGSLPVLAVIALALDYVEPLSTRRRAHVGQTGERCEAVVIRIDNWKHEGTRALVKRREYKVVIKFVDWNGHTQRVEGEIGRRWSYSRRELRIDDAVHIAYDKAKPTDLVYLDVAPVKGLHRLTDVNLNLAIAATILGAVLVKTTLE